MNLEEIVERLGLDLRDSPHGTEKVYPKKFVPDFYQPLVGKLAISRVLEIGVRGGASIRMWSEFLKEVPDSKVVGIDNFSDVRSINFCAS